jgi:hypothetical protein
MFMRPATLSLKTALEELGFGPCYHMSELFEHPDHIELWVAAAKGQPIDWNDFFRGYRATLDGPGGASYRDRSGGPGSPVAMAVSGLRSSFTHIGGVAGSTEGVLVAE